MASASFGSHRLVHLDLKGAPPKLSYFEQLFPVLREWGATGILVEWEDTFPYTRDLLQIGSNGPANRTKNYSAAEARQLLQLAGDNGLAVVPLVQTFGHLEFVLKHKEWKDLREVENYPSSMCPSHPRALPLVTSLIKQIVDFHKDIQYLHIGADEVWHLGLCPTCVRRIESNKHGRCQLFLEHVAAVAQYVRDTFPSLHIIMWDDMLRSIDTSVLLEYNLGRYVELMVWHYQAADGFQITPELWEKYSSVFSSVWVATAFKGATGSCQVLPVIQHHISNHEHWLLVLTREASKFKYFRGVALTGWSRYDHYATMCELLPVALPSLYICLKVWISGSFTPEIHLDAVKTLGYHEVPLLLVPYPRPQPVAQQLNFPGWRVNVAVEWYANLRVKFRNIVESDQVEAWMNQWQITHGFTNPMQIENIVPALTDLGVELQHLEHYLRESMEDIYCSATIDEWIGTKLDPLNQKVCQLKKDAENQIVLGSSR